MEECERHTDCTSEPSCALPRTVVVRAPLSFRSELDFCLLTRDWLGPLKLSDACLLMAGIMTAMVKLRNERVGCNKAYVDYSLSRVKQLNLARLLDFLRKFAAFAQRPAQIHA